MKTRAAKTAAAINVPAVGAARNAYPETGDILFARLLAQKSGPSN